MFSPPNPPSWTEFLTHNCSTWLIHCNLQVYLTRKPSRAIFDYEVTPRLCFTADGEDVPAAVELNVAVDVEDWDTEVTTTTAFPAAGDGGEGGLATDSINTATELFTRVELWSMAQAQAHVQTEAQTLVAHAAFPVLRGCNGRRVKADAHAGLAADSADHYTGSGGGGADAGAGTGAEAGRGPLRCHAEGVLVLDPTAMLLWTAETPSLYICVLSLHASRAAATKGTHALDAESCRVGFRQVAIDSPVGGGTGAGDAAGAGGPMLLVNNRPITVRGVNRHEFSPSTGRAVDEDRYRAAPRTTYHVPRTTSYELDQPSIYARPSH
jgi:hypothetical protein